MSGETIDLRVPMEGYSISKKTTRRAVLADAAAMPLAAIVPALQAAELNLAGNCYRFSRGSKLCAPSGVRRGMAAMRRKNAHSR
jgi:hypothetical protein